MSTGLDGINNSYSIVRRQIAAGILSQRRAYLWHGYRPAAYDPQLPVLRRSSGEAEIADKVGQALGIGAFRCPEPVLQEKRRRRLIIKRRQHGSGARVPFQRRQRDAIHQRIASAATVVGI